MEENKQTNEQGEKKKKKKTSKLTLVPVGLVEHLVAPGLFLGNILGSGFLVDLAVRFLAVALQCVEVGHLQSLFNG